jgi:alginate O-acetyltransferase complex protein AlgI
MSFTSGAFFVLMAVFMAAWPVVRRGGRSRWAAITAASFVFYGWWDWRFLGLLVGTGLVDFAAALTMDARPGWRKALLWISVVANLGSLAFFKYLGFAVDQVAQMLELPPRIASAADDIVLPVGISFYTFQSLSYTIDVYRGRIRAVRDPLHFFAFLSMFPQLVAGPIVRATDLLPQLETPGHFNRANRLEGLRIASWGYVKKVVVADALAPVVNDAFAVEPALGLAWWVIMAAFAVQIFCDFSGYSDIACGIAMWLGYRFPENFRRPYAAVGFRDFWSRWHITLSTWFRDYVYVPLGGSRRGAARTIVNQAFTMLVSGLWHGANWTFVAWGGFHAVLLATERALVPARPRPRPPVARLVGWAFTVAAILMGWVLFRADSIGQAWSIIVQMAGGRAAGALPHGLLVPSVVIAAALMALACLHHSVARIAPSMHAARWPAPIKASAIVLALLASVFLRGPGGDFIYFQF